MNTYTPPDWMIPELDFAILAMLPKVGTLAGGYVPVGMSAKGVHERLGVDVLTVGNVTGRLKDLTKKDYVKQVKTLVSEDGQTHRVAGRAMAYQVTTTGLRALHQWESGQAAQREAAAHREGTNESA